jgi:hypothetical protein
LFKYHLLYITSLRRHTASDIASTESSINGSPELAENTSYVPVYTYLTLKHVNVLPIQKLNKYHVKICEEKGAGMCLCPDHSFFPSILESHSPKMSKLVPV